MRRWTTAEKEWLGYRRKLANNMKVSLKKAPWEKSSIELKAEMVSSHIDVYDCFPLIKERDACRWTRSILSPHRLS